MRLVGRATLRSWSPPRPQKKNLSLLVKTDSIIQTNIQPASSFQKVGGWFMPDVVHADARPTHAHTCAHARCLTHFRVHAKKGVSLKLFAIKGASCFCEARCCSPLILCTALLPVVPAAHVHAAPMRTRYTAHILLRFHIVEGAPWHMVDASADRSA